MLDPNTYSESCRILETRDVARDEAARVREASPTEVANELAKRNELYYLVLLNCRDKFRALGDVKQVAEIDAVLKRDGR